MLYSFYKNNFIRTKALILAKKLKNKLRTKPGFLSRRTWKRSALAKHFWNDKDRTSEQCLVVTYVVLDVDYSHTLTSLSFLMTTSYSKNIHLSNLFVYYTLDCEASLSSCLSIKTSFFFLTFCCIFIPISGIIDHYCIMEIFFKKLGENKNKLRTICPKNHENFKNGKPRVQFYWFL